MTVEQAYGTYSRDMLRYSMYFLKNHHDAEDAVSECFLNLMRSEGFARLSGERQKAYIFRALRNICFTMLRRRAREQTPVYENEPAVPAADDSAVIKADIQRAIAGLGERSGKVIRLRLLHDKEISDISKQMGLSETNVKIMIFRGKKQLVRALGEQYAS